MAAFFATKLGVCIGSIMPKVVLSLMVFGVILIVEGCLPSMCVASALLRVCCMGAALGMVYSLAPFKSFASSKVVPDAHAACLDARDYSGCVNSFQNGVQKGGAGEKCWLSGRQKRCLAGEGSDRFGMPKIASSIYEFTDDGSIRYWFWDGTTRDKSKNPSPTVFFVPHKNKRRFIANGFRLRYYQAPVAGTPGSSTTIGSAQTNCYGYGNYVNCTTTPPPKINLPGRAPSPGGVRTVSVAWVYDCIDKTIGTYVDGKLKGNWKKISIPDGACGRIDALKKWNLKL